MLLSSDSSGVAFHRWYWAGRHTAHGRYPAAMAVASSAKKTRYRR
ncbi:hypothetical protein Y717_16645 [Streptomyces scopuliridis RB72]|uniref:Uncharacterized protein n=1 Tax=Streptomyces scopuliridis RB72 TaxID=1440053 RepID=A0A2T7T0A5_9ACTN|nr:hypothetical protein Y717_16645 [Streptomyces scopuliridis RB72]